MCCFCHYNTLEPSEQRTLRELYLPVREVILSTEVSKRVHKREGKRVLRSLNALFVVQRSPDHNYCYITVVKTPCTVQLTLARKGLHTSAVCNAHVSY